MGPFSYSQSQIDRVFRYVQNQEKHHADKSFQRRVHRDFEKFNVDYDEKFLFDW